MSLATTFPIPEGCGPLEAHGQGRVVGFLIPRPHGSLRAVVIHLDYPGVSMEFRIPPAYTVGVGPTVSNLLPSPALAFLSVTLFPSRTSASQPKV